MIFSLRTFLKLFMKNFSLIWIIILSYWYNLMIQVGFSVYMEQIAKTLLITTSNLYFNLNGFQIIN